MGTVYGEEKDPGSGGSAQVRDSTRSSGAPEEEADPRFLEKAPLN